MDHFGAGGESSKGPTRAARLALGGGGGAGAKVGPVWSYAASSSWELVRLPP